MLSILFTCLIIFGSGLLLISIDTSANGLWVDQHGRSKEESDYFSDTFGTFFRINTLLVLPKKPEAFKENIFQKKYLYQLQVLQDAIEAKEFKMNNKTISMHELCYKPITHRDCLITSPLNFWQRNLTDLEIDKDLDYTALCVETRKEGTQACTDVNGIPIIKDSVFGGVKCVVAEDIPCQPCKTHAKALVITYLLNNDEFSEEEAMKWEKKAFEDNIDNFNDGSLFKNVNGKNYQHIYTGDLQAVYMAERSIPDTLVEETGDSIGVVIVSYILMFIYIAVGMGNFPSFVHSGFLLGVFGIFIVICAVLCSIGLASFFGVKLSLISGEVVPFLILAIGVDNMFIISNSLERQAGDSIGQRMGMALEEVGPSITTAAFCEFLAFVVGTFTKIPALTSFCYIAAAAVIFDYIFQLTAFVAFLSWDEKRRQENRYDIVFCIKRKERQKSRKQFVHEFFKTVYIPVLFNKFTKVLVIITVICLFLVTLFNAHKLDIGLDQKVSVVSGSTLYKYFDYEETYGEIGPPAYIILKNIDYQNLEDIKVLGDMGDALSKAENIIKPPLYNWYSTFTQYITPDAEWVEACDTEDITLYPFNEQVKRFVTVRIDSVCCLKYGICGETFEKDIIFDENDKIVSSRLRFQHNPLRKQKDYIDSVDQARSLIDHYSKKFKGKDKEAFAYSLFYQYFDQYSYVRGLAISNIIIACGVIYGAVLILKTLSASLFTTLCVFLTTVDIIGMVSLTNQIFKGHGVEINAVSIVNLLVTVGLSNEFCVHIVTFYTQAFGTATQRAKRALNEMGSSILIGIVATKFFGVVVLGFATSTIFKLYYFRMYLMIIFLGTIHGLIFLPVLLSLIGKTKYDKNVKDSITERISARLSERLSQKPLN